MKMFRVVLLTSACLIIPASAQEMRIDLTKLPPDVAAAIVKAQQDKNVKLPTTIEEAEKYAAVGKQVGEAIAATAKALSVESNEFVKTPLGWWVFVFVFWYFLGAKLWHIVGGILFWAVSLTLLWKSRNYFHGRQRVLVHQNGKEKQYDYKTYQWKGEEAKCVSAFAHVVAFAAVTLVALLLIF